MVLCEWQGRKVRGLGSSGKGGQNRRSGPRGSLFNSKSTPSSNAPSPPQPGSGRSGAGKDVHRDGMQGDGSRGAHFCATAGWLRFLLALGGLLLAFLSAGWSSSGLSVLGGSGAFFPGSSRSGGRGVPHLLEAVAVAQVVGGEAGASGVCGTAASLLLLSTGHAPVHGLFQTSPKTVALMASSPQRSRERSLFGGNLKTLLK